jgi:hypothetical protein
MDPDADPAIFVIDLQVSAYYFLKAHLHLFFKDKKPKRSRKAV